MPLKIIRNDITRMTCEAIVNTANSLVQVGPGCDSAVYQAAGRDRLLAYRRDHIGIVREGEVFLTPAFDLPVRYIIHAVSPQYRGGSASEERKLRACYRKSLELAARKGITSIAFPLISTGSFGYPREEGMRIALDEIRAFLAHHDMLVYLVVFGEEMTELGRRYYPDLQSYIDRNYVEEKQALEYLFRPNMPSGSSAARPEHGRREQNSFFAPRTAARPEPSSVHPECSSARSEPSSVRRESSSVRSEPSPMQSESSSAWTEQTGRLFSGEQIDDYQSALEERMQHLSDTFSEYLLYLIRSRGMTNAEVYKRAIVDKKVFSKIKNNKHAHPQKITAMCLCVGACLNLDETRDLLARAGYALSPCDKTDIIFSYFIEHGIYDMIELDIQLEEHDLPCLIS